MVNIREMVYNMYVYIYIYGILYLVYLYIMYVHTHVCLNISMFSGRQTQYLRELI